MGKISNVQTSSVRSGALQSLIDTCNRLDTAFFRGARHTLINLVADTGLLDGLSPLDEQEFSRTLLSRDPMNRFGIWALWWPAGSETPIHNHHCSCAFAVYRGRIEEILYDGAQDPGGAVERRRFIRQTSYIGGGANNSQVIHRMKNPDGDWAVSIHLYAYHPDHYENSVKRSFVEASKRTSGTPAH